MENKIAGQMAEMSQRMVDTMTSLQKINERTMKELAQQQLQAAEGFVDTGAKRLKDLSGVKTVQEAMSTQAEITTEVGKMMVNNARATMDVLARSQEELKSLMENNISEMMKNVPKP